MSDARSQVPGRAALWRRSARDPAVAESLDAENPFPGPKPYRRDQKKLFFGRRNEVEELTSLVLSTSAVLLYAPSGSGKSSLLQAGLVPSLEGFGYRILPAVRFGRISRQSPDGGADIPQPNPFAKLVWDAVLPDGALSPDGRDLDQLADRLRDANGEMPALLILDQFEELFASQAFWQERAAFLAQLRRALDTNAWLRAVLAIRSDYLGNLLPHERELPVLIRYGLESLREPAARQAIEKTFARTQVPLTHTELNLVLDRLLRIDVGPPAAQVRGQYVNLIQLQILCRRLWREKAKPGSAGDPGNPDGSQVLEESKVDLTDYMQSFVDDALPSVVAQTRADEGVVRHWLKERLTTDAGRRAVVFVDNEKTAGLPQEVLKALENARLIQVEQRNESQWAELTHDSMVAAVRGSNDKWTRIRRRARLRQTALLTVLLAALLALFPLLRVPRDETLLADAAGTFAGPALRIPFAPAPRGHVAVVHVALDGEANGGATVSIVGRDQGKNQGGQLLPRVVAPVKNGAVHSTINFVFTTPPPASYAVLVKAPGLRRGNGFLQYRVTVRSAPVVLAIQKPGPSRVVSVNSPLFAVKLYPHRPLYLELIFADLQNVWAAQSLIKDASAQQMVIESAGGQGYAALWIRAFSNGAPATQVEGQLAEQGPPLRLGGQADIRAANASVSPVAAGNTSTPFAVSASCKSGFIPTMDVIDSAGQSVRSTARSLPAGSVLVPAAHGSGYRLVMLSNSDGNCPVSVRSFAQQTITATSNREIEIPPDSSFNAYPIRLPADAAMIVTSLNGAAASLDCPPGNIAESDSARLVGFAPGNHQCVLSIARSSIEMEKTRWSRPVSFPLLIVPTSGR